MVGVGPPFFSIIIPTLNEERCLPRLLDSLRVQTFREFEVITVDGFSRDATPVLAADIGRVIQVNGRPAIARNVGAEIATGEYLLFCDADIVLPDAEYLADMHQHVECHPVEHAYAPFKTFDEIAYPQIIIRDDPAWWLSVNLVLNLVDIGLLHIFDRLRFMAVGGFRSDISVGENVEISRRLWPSLLPGRFVVYTSDRRHRQISGLEHAWINLCNWWAITFGHPTSDGSYWEWRDAGRSV